MKLKEAQLLGILAFIAGVIIILCIWGGGRKKQLVSQYEGDELEATQEERDMVWGVDEVLDRFREEQRRREETPPVEQEHRIGEEIESKAPEDIPLQPTHESIVKKRIAPRIHVVQKGDTLSEISRKYYNTVSKWKTIFEANRSLISRPEDLRPKMKLVIPGLDEPRPAVPQAGEPKVVGNMVSAGKSHTLSAGTSAAGSKYYDVKKGDTLWQIAERSYGDGNEWKKILQANSDLLDSAQDLQPNMRLVLP